LHGDDEQGGVPHANFRNEVLGARPSNSQQADVLEFIAEWRINQAQSNNFVR